MERKEREGFLVDQDFLGFADYRSTQQKSLFFICLYDFWPIKKNVEENLQNCKPSILETNIRDSFNWTFSKKL